MYLLLLIGKKNKSAGPNRMESLTYAGHKHLSFFFTFCNQHRYLPDTFTESAYYRR